jgi:hypothetical protein
MYQKSTGLFAGVSLLNTTANTGIFAIANNDIPISGDIDGDYFSSYSTI